MSKVIAKRNQQVLDTFKPIILVSKSMGSFPLEKEMDWETGRYRYKFKLLSTSTLYCLVYNFILISLLIGMYLGPNLKNEAINDLLGFRLHQSQILPKDRNSLSTTARFIRESYSIIGPVAGIVNTILLTVSCTELASFVSKWQDFEESCHEAFPQSKQHPFDSMTSYRNRIAKFYLIFGTLPNLFNTFILVAVYTSLQSFRGIIIMGFVGVSTLSSLLLREYCSVLMFHALSDAFKWLNAGIISTDEEKVSLNDVRQWICLIEMIRSQIRVAERTLGANEIFCIFHNGVTYLSTFFFFYRISSSGTELRFVLGGLWIVCWMLCRLILRVTIAEGVSREEKAIATTLLDKSYSKADTRTRLEIKCLVNTILTHPSVIRFGNVITFNRGLVIGIISHVVSYLIVAIQLDSLETL